MVTLGPECKPYINKHITQLRNMQMIHKGHSRSFWKGHCHSTLLYTLYYSQNKRTTKTKTNKKKTNPNFILTVFQQLKNILQVFYQVN
jgi:hypothetical protein